jgi:hypothetical protein
VEKQAQQLWENKALRVAVEKAAAPSTDLSELESSYDQSSPVCWYSSHFRLDGHCRHSGAGAQTRTLQRMLTLPPAAHPLLSDTLYP